MALKGALRQTKFDKSFLFHEFRVGAIVYDIRTEDWRRQRGINLFGVEIIVATIQDEIVAVDAKVACDPLAEKNERENIPVLLES